MIGDLRKRWLLLTVEIVLMGFLVTVVYRYEAWDFIHNLWVPARLLLAGQDPYDAGTTALLLRDLGQGPGSSMGQGPGISIWLPTALTLALPLACLPAWLAANLWCVLNLVALGFSVVITLQAGFHGSGSFDLASPRLVVGLLLLMVFPPLLTHLGFGQTTLLVMALVQLAAWLISKGHYQAAGVVLSTAVLKPQLLIVVLPVLAFYAGRHGLVRMAVSGLLALLAQTVPLFILYPAWPTSFLRALRNNPTWAQPSLQTALREITGNPWPGWTIWVVITGLAVLWLRAEARRRPDLLRITSLALALTPMVTVYVWSWDFVLMLPAMVLLLVDLRLSRVIFIWEILYVIVVAGTLWVPLAVSRNDMYRFPLPYLVLLLDVVARRLATGRWPWLAPPAVPQQG